MMRFPRRLLLFILLMQAYDGYAGVIKGYVLDSLSGEAIPGARVLLRGTASTAVSGLDGSYAILNIPAGSYNLDIGGTTLRQYTRHLSIADTQTIVIDQLVSVNHHTLQEVQVTGRPGAGSARQALSIESNSDNIISVLPAATIELLPDITVANLLQRVSGVTVQRDNSGEARYAIIRGMDKRYNYTTVNGLKIPGADDKMRYLPMDIFPAELVDRVEVIKTLTPGIDGDAVGGVMNLAMKNAPDQLTVNASLGTGYNQTLLDRSYQAFPKSGLQLKDPVELHGTNYAASPADFQRRSIDTRNGPAPANGFSSLTIGNRFLKNKRLGAVFSGCYQNTFKGSDNIFFLPSIQPGENNAPVITNVELRKYATQETRTGLHTRLDYIFNDRNTLSIYVMHLQLLEQQTRDITDTSVQINRTGAGTGEVDHSVRSAFRRQAIDHAALQGSHALALRLKLNYSLAASQATRDVPDMAELKTTANAYLDPAGHSAMSQYRFVSVTHSWARTKDADKTAYVHLIFTPSVAGKEVELAGGGTYRHKDRTNYYNDYTLQPVAVNQLFENVYATSMTVLQPGGNVHSDLNYSITENISAGYVQAKTTLGSLTILGGARVEHTALQYAMNVDSNIVAGQNARYAYTDVLPGLHLKYVLGRKEQLRLSYYKSISRPGFFELVPYHFSGEYYAETGNDSLNHTVAHNFDLRYERTWKRQDHLVAGIFYKTLSDPIEYLLSNQPGKLSMGQLTPTNVQGKPAVNYGAEIVAAKYFHSFGISANYTFTHSSITTTRLSRLRDSSGNLHNYTVASTRPLQGQSAHVANLALIYKNPKLGLDANVSWVYTGRRIAFLSGFEGLDYWQRATSFFDLSCEKMIGSRISLYAKVNNLLNTAVIIELLKPKDQFVSGSYQLPYQTLSNSTLVEKDLYGRNYLLGLRYKMDRRQ